MLDRARRLKAELERAAVAKAAAVPVEKAEDVPVPADKREAEAKKEEAAKRRKTERASVIPPGPPGALSRYDEPDRQFMNNWI